MREIHEINETLIKIRAGRFETVIGASLVGGSGAFAGTGGEANGGGNLLSGFDGGLFDLEDELDVSD